MFNLKLMSLFVCVCASIVSVNWLVQEPIGLEQLSHLEQLVDGAKDYVFSEEATVVRGDKLINSFEVGWFPTLH